MYEIMTPGPTQVHPDVLASRSCWAPNPDLDPAFLHFYHQTAQQLTRLIGGRDDYQSLLLSGEGMLALEACVATLTQPGDRVLILDNGVFGAGFADLVRLYGGLPMVYNMDDRRAFDPVALGIYLEHNHKFKYATMVHCDTPGGILNPVEQLCPVLKRHGILTVVDAVASMFGERLNVSFGLDFTCGASQKALSAPAGLSFVTLSPDAQDAIRQRETPVSGFYLNLQNYMGYHQSGEFPYTMPAHDIQGLATALRRVEEDPDRYSRHDLMARGVRAALERGGLVLHPQNGFSSTVTAFQVPAGLSDKAILDTLRQDHGILLANSFGRFAGKLLRIGHMGENCQREKLLRTLGALQQVLSDLGFCVSEDLCETFSRRT